MIDQLNMIRSHGVEFGVACIPAIPRGIQIWATCNSPAGRRMRCDMLFDVELLHHLLQHATLRQNDLQSWDLTDHLVYIHLLATFSLHF